VSLVGIPEVRSEDGTILKFSGIGEFSCLNWPSVQFVQEVNEFGPVASQGGDILTPAYRLGLEGHFPKSTALVPVEEKEAVKPSDGGLGLVDSIQSGATEEDPVTGRGDEGADLELFFHCIAAVSEFELIERGSLGGRSIFSQVLGSNVASYPFLIPGMELPDAHGDDPPITALEGNAGAIAGKIFGLEATVAFKVAPCTDGS